MDDRTITPLEGYMVVKWYAQTMGVSVNTACKYLEEGLKSTSPDMVYVDESEGK